MEIVLQALSLGLAAQATIVGTNVMTYPVNIYQKVQVADTAVVKWTLCLQPGDCNLLLKGQLPGYLTSILLSYHLNYGLKSLL